MPRTGYRLVRRIDILFERQKRKIGDREMRRTLSTLEAQVSSLQHWQSHNPARPVPTISRARS
jgi:hypothetical protein